jgi:1-deoxy-D-xylulose-5-phosphate synthase
MNDVDVFTPIYSTFIQRAYDQMNHDIARQNANVVFGMDRSGLVGADGETHQGVFDIPLLRHIPNMTIVHPRNAIEAHKLLNYGFLKNNGPFAIRYERGNASYDFSKGITDEISTMRWEQLTKGNSATFIAFGTILDQVSEELEKMGVEVIDAKVIKPLDEEALNRIYGKNKPVIIYEESVLSGGFGSSCLEYFSSKKYHVETTLMGIKDQYVLQGSKAELLRELGLDKMGVIKQVSELL